jgi:hypothetical protein
MCKCWSSVSTSHSNPLPPAASQITNNLFEFNFLVCVFCLLYSLTYYMDHLQSRKSILQPLGSRRADHASPLYPQKLALTSPTSGVRSRTQATKHVFCLYGPSTLFTWLSPLRSLALSKIKKNALEGTKKCHSWHQKSSDNVTARYSGKRSSRLFPAVAPWSHEVHSFTGKIFRRRQHPVVHRKANFAFKEPFRELNCGSRTVTLARTRHLHYIAE